MQKLFGVSWKTTLAGYLLAIWIAVQPFIEAEGVDFTDRQQRIKFVLRIIGAALVAVLGKYSADSKQVKNVDEKLELFVATEASPLTKSRVKKLNVKHGKVNKSSDLGEGSEQDL